MNINQNKQQYDQAQKVGERVERMCKEEGWKEHFIPKIKKIRDEAQAIVNNPKTDPSETQFQRGILSLADEVLGYEKHTISSQLTIMRNSSDARAKEILGKA